MNTLRKMRKNAKALSPVVASIILIAVTVAVSIAVAAWMGALVVNQMDTEQIQMGAPSFTATSVTVTVKNSGTSPLVVSKVYVNGDPVTPTSPTLPYTLNENAEIDFVLPYDIITGDNYEIRLVTAKNNPFATSGIAGPA